MSLFWSLVTESPKSNYSCIKCMTLGSEGEKIEFIYEFYFIFYTILNKINTNVEYKDVNLSHQI